MTSPTRDGRRVLLHLGLVLAFLLAPLSSLVAHLYFTLQFFGESTEPSEYEAAAVSVLLVTVGFALLSTFVLVVLRPQPWVHLLAAVGATLMLLLAADAHESAQTAVPDREAPNAAVDRGEVAAAVGSAAASPTGWPLLAFAIGAGVVQVRGRSSRAPRAAQDRSSVPAGPR
jgi:hypothetical protein